MLVSFKEFCFFVLCRIVCIKNGVYFYKFLGISYFIICDEFKKYVLLFVNDLSDYCLYSFKLGGVFNDGYKLSDFELKDRYVGWKNFCIKRCYIKCFYFEMFEVIRSMGI